MSSKPSSAPEISFLAGGGKMGKLIRAFDWATTPLGPAASWRPSLKAMVRMALTTGHPIFIFWGPQLTCFYNDAYSESLGPEKHPSILGMPGAQAWPEIWHIIGPQIELVFRGEGATWNENALVPILRNGRVEDVYWTYSYGPIDDADSPNGVGGVLVICTETTEQVLAERKLAHQHERFIELFEQAPTFMAVLRGPEHRFELANPGYMKLVQHRNVIGLTVAEALPEAEEQGYVKVLDEVYATGKSFSAHGAKFSQPGPAAGPPEERYLDFVYQPMRDGAGQITGIFVEGVDVTDRRAAELRLLQAEERLRMAMDASLLGTFDVDLDAGTVAFSQRSLDLFDLDNTRVTLHDCFERVPHEEHAAVQATIDAARAEGSDGRYRMRHRVVHRNGNVVWVSVVGSVVRTEDVDGAVRERLTGVLWDVTEQQALMEQLRQSDRRKDEFLATLAHELRNPLAPIRTAAHLLARPDLSPAHLAECSQVIQRQTRTMALLLDDLLEVSRITSGKLALRRALVSTRSIVDAALEATRASVDAKSHALSVVVHDPAPWLDADALRLAQVLINLLNNAVKYTDRGGRILLEVRLVDGHVEFDIVDSGIGLELSTRPRLFEMFHQVRGQRDRAEGGLGIGLALSKALVESHGGKLDAFSQGLGQGSTFRVTLPSVAGPAISPPQAPSPDDALQPKRLRKLLVADDNIDAAESMAMLLQSEGHEVVMAHDGLRALAVAEIHRPDTALLDIGMPGLDGYQVASRLRATDWGRGMLIVAMTGWGQVDDKRRANEAGFDAHLTKPVAIEALMQLLDKPPREPT